MSTVAVQDLPPARRRRLIALGLLRSLAATVVLVVLFYALPLDRLADVPLWVSLGVALLALLAVSAQQVRAILKSAHPGVRAVEALATTAPLFLLLFAATYYVLAKSDAGNFSVHTLTRTDSLYFTVTVFSTVGFGDITATSQTARLVVTTQMILDLIVLGLGIRMITGAVQIARQHQPPSAASPESPGATSH